MQRHEFAPPSIPTTTAAAARPGSTPAPAPRRLVAAFERVVISADDEALFDGALYLERNPDVREAGAGQLRRDMPARTTD